MNLHAAITHVLLFTPDVGIVVLTLSTGLIFLELNRPGMIVPGTLGLLGVLLVIHSWQQWELSLLALLLLVAAVLLCLWQVRHTSSPSWAFVSALAFSTSFTTVITGPIPMRVRPAVSILCGCVLGGSASLLARIAHRARRNKGLD